MDARENDERNDAMKHVMVDLETFGTDPNCAFISIGAVKFDPLTGLMSTDTFYRRINWESAMAGRSIKPSTLYWWFRQSAEAIAEIIKQGDQLEDVLRDFKAWFPEDGIIWGNGATFDVSILQNAYGDSCPWDFWNVHDVRTVVSLSEGIIDRKSIPFDGVPHHALHDAIHQVKYVSAMWQAMRAGR